MIEKPIDILKLYPIRKSKKQKMAFRDAVTAYAEKLGYKCITEKGSMGCRNLIIGHPESAKHLITAHYDTCAGMLIPNLIAPCNFWLFIILQLFVTLCLVFPACLIGFATRLITQQFLIGEVVFLGVLFLVMILMMYGPANRNNANDNTSGVVTLLEILKSFPETRRDQVCFILFDMEESGLVGSSSYRTNHKDQVYNQLVWNLDCVGEGDDIVLFPNRKVKKDTEFITILERCATQLKTKSVSIRKKEFSFYPSDQMSFPYGVGIAALKKSKYGFYLSKIHTRNDTTLDETNVNILRAAIISAITCDGV